MTPLHYSSRRLGLGLIGILSIASAVLRAQDAPIPSDLHLDLSPSLQRCVGYGSAIRELHHSFQQQSDIYKQLIENRFQILARLTESENEIRQLRSNRMLSAYMREEASFLGDALKNEMENVIANHSKNLPPGTAQFRFPRFARVEIPRSDVFIPEGFSELSKGLIQTELQISALGHQLKTLQVAERVTLERRFELIAELSDLVKSAQAWMSSNHALLNRYWEIADVEGSCCRIQLRAALRELEILDPENVGAFFVKAITLCRLGELEQALKIIDELTTIPIMKPIALATRAEIQFRLGEKRKANLDLKESLLIGKQDVRVRLHRGLAMCVAGEFREAEVELETVLKLGTQEIVARRLMAHLNTSISPMQDIHKSKAADNAILASDLTGGTDWNCEIALAIAEAANGRKEMALQAADRAIELAIGDKQTLCAQIREQLQLGHAVAWSY